MPIHLRRMTEDDVAGVIRCFESCYGRTYINSFYDPVWMREQIRSGWMRSVVAVDDEAGIVAHMALKLFADGALACEAGSTVVDPAFRKLGLMSRMGTMITDLCRSEGFVGNVNEPTTAHEIMQKGSTLSGGVETGILLELIPAETIFHDFDVPAGRTAATVVYQPLAPAPARSVLVPAVYRDLLEGLYREAGLERTLVEARLARRPAGVEDVSLTTDTLSEQHRLRRLLVEGVGADFEALVDAQQPIDVEVTHVDLCLDDPLIESAFEALRDRGFFYCALLPECARTDLLRLQRLHAPGPRAFAPNLVHAGAKSLLEMMRSEAGVD